MVFVLVTLMLLEVVTMRRSEESSWPEFLQSFHSDDDERDITESVTEQKMTKSQRKLERYGRCVDRRREKRPEERRRRRARQRQVEDGRKCENGEGEDKAIGRQVTELMTSGLHICIDLSVTSCMSAKERGRLARQLGRVWATQKKTSRPPALMISGAIPDSDLMAECRRVCTGFDSYKWLRREQGVQELFSPEQLIYLCPDADALPLLDLENEDRILVIGGLVDETGQGTVSRRTAERLGSVFRRLPIQEFMDRTDNGSLNTMLPINQVFQILVYVSETADWTTALASTVPRRTGYVAKNLL